MKLTEEKMAERLAERVAQRGGAAYYVGGFVRDRVRGADNKDIDVEIHGITPATLEEILDELGERLELGASFGIYGLRGYQLDIAMPRRETCRGQGHRDFDVSVDPMIGTRKAALRRDFTINALMQNVLTGEVIDHFGGLNDLERGILRHVDSETFGEDPLRVLRGAQFAARFGFTVAEETVALCRTMDLSALSRERVFGELEKALNKAERPAVFFEVLREMNQLSCWFPELEALIGVEQNPRFHREGDVWNHTMLVLNAAVPLAKRTENPLGLLLTAITHDFGKALCTETINGVIHAYGHETKGLAPAGEFLHRLTNQRKLVQYVLNLTELHMKPNVAAASGAGVKSTNKMFDRAVDPEGLICIALADSRGRLLAEGEEDNEAFLYDRLQTYRAYMARPYVMGRDLIAAGVAPGEHFARCLELAHKLRLAGVDKDSALKQTLALARKK